MAVSNSHSFNSIFWAPWIKHWVVRIKGMSREDLVSTFERFVVLTVLLHSLPAGESHMALCFTQRSLQGCENIPTLPTAFLVLHSVTWPAESLVPIECCGFLFWCGSDSPEMDRHSRDITIKLHSKLFYPQKRWFQTKCVYLLCPQGDLVFNIHLIC